ncbi:hypothetical protein TNCT_327411 [Trichonephila clavata]|uniref:Uncharacterized protein n=1 Tax=Trichonephila clavata TaxID=2740835 RepID=A0A8X6FY93_TRICU|nr:hypothetical protein TNCT_327411 [Trichonephila clavata]
MKTFCVVLIVSLFLTAVNAADCPDTPCPDGKYCVRVLGTRSCVNAAKNKRPCSAGNEKNKIYEMVPPCADGLTCDTDKVIPTCK